MLQFTLTILAIALIIVLAVLLFLRSRRTVTARYNGVPPEPTAEFGNEPVPGPVLRGADGLWGFLKRHQEFSGWLPLCIGLLVIGFIVFGALDRQAGTDLLPAAAALPLKIAYAVAALGLTLLFRRRWRYKLSAYEQERLWANLTNGFSAPANWGAITVHITDAVLSLCALYWLLRFFSLPA